MDDALATLQAAGFVERFPGVNRHTSSDHAITLAQVDPSGRLLSEIDVHDRFVGIDAPPEESFEELWRRREPDRLAHVDVAFPDLPTRALLLVLNTARTDTDQAREDLTRLLASGDTEGWEDVVILARRVRALSGLRAGLEVDPAGAAVVAEMGLSDVAISREWALRRSGSPRTALRLDEFRRLPWRARPGAVLSWLFPSPAIIRMRDPRAHGNRAKLLGGYVRRLRDGVTSVLPSARALARIRRNRRSDDSSMGDS
jgi:hypothetical protein